MDILTVTLNPALDLATHVPQVVAGPKLRGTAPTAEPGGGGVNVARAVVQLGGQARALVALGGPNGDALGARVQAQGIGLIRHDAPGDTRLSLAVTDDAGAQFRFVLPGPAWDGAALDGALARIVREARGLVVLSGSLPPGADPDWIARLAGALDDGTRLIVDTSGAALTALAGGMTPAPWLLRMDSAEAEEIAGRRLDTRVDSAAFAADLVARGAADHVIVARGAEGSVMAGPTGRHSVNATNDHVVSAVGAGDSFVGGFALALSHGAAPHEALRHGAAAASAAVLTPGTELCRKADFDALLPRTLVTPI